MPWYSRWLEEEAQGPWTDPHRRLIAEPLSWPWMARLYHCRKKGISLLRTWRTRETLTYTQPIVSTPCCLFSLDVSLRNRDSLKSLLQMAAETAPCVQEWSWPRGARSSFKTVFVRSLWLRLWPLCALRRLHIPKPGLYSFPLTLWTPITCPWKPFSARAIQNHVLFFVVSNLDCNPGRRPKYCSAYKLPWSPLGARSLSLGSWELRQV